MPVSDLPRAVRPRRLHRLSGGTSTERTTAARAREAAPPLALVADPPRAARAAWRWGAAAALAMAGWLVHARSGSPAAPGEAGTPGAAADAGEPPLAVPVRAAVVRRGTLVVAISANGVAHGWREAEVVAEATGRVTGVFVADDQPVDSGTVLLALDPADARAGAAEAEAALHQAQAQLREATLLDQSLPDSLRAQRLAAVRVRAGVEVAEARLARARLELLRTRPVAPFAGRVASLRVAPGAWVRAGEALLSLVVRDPLRVQVPVLEREVAGLHPGGQALVSFAAAAHARPGVIVSINPMVEGPTRTARVELRVPNPAGPLLPGMFAQVALETAHLPGRLLLPREAVLERDGRSLVFVYRGAADEGRARWRYVRLGAENDSLVEVLPEPGGLRAGERVLVEGQSALVDDARVRLLAPAASLPP